LAARVWTITATAERHHHEPLTYLTDYLRACAVTNGKPPQGQALDRFLPWIPAPTDTRDHDPPKIIDLGASPNLERSQIDPHTRPPAPTTAGPSPSTAITEYLRQ